MTKELTCIVCPKGCRLKVDTATFQVEGHSCPRGEEYGSKELQNPVRVVTSTVMTDSRIHPRLPVKTDGAIKKSLVLKATSLLDGVQVKLPVSIGDVILENILDSGINFVATRSLTE